MMKKWKHWLLPTVLLLSLGLAACSNEEPEEEAESTDTAQTDNETTDDNMEQEPDEPATGEDEEETNNDEHIEHQLGLSVGDTATVISSTEEYKYEVTLNELRGREEMDGLPKYDNVMFVIANVTIKNIDERSFSTSAIFEPSIGVQETDEYKPPVEQDLLQGVSELDLFEGELAPNETITGDYVFRLEEAENYNFAFGIETDQITTRAEWEFSSDEIQ